MKVALVIDHLLERDNLLFNFELFLGVFKEAKVYTLAHNSEKIHGALSLRKISSSYLSNICGTVNDLEKHFHLWPSALKTLKIDEDVDLVLSFGRGISHCIAIPTKAQHIPFFYAPNSYRPKGWLARLLGAHTKAFLNKTRTFENIITSDESLISALSINCQQQHVLKPVFKTEDFPMVADESVKNLDLTFILVRLCADASIELQREFFLKNKERKIIAFSDVGNCREIVKDFEKGDVDILDRSCSGTIAARMQNALLFIDFDDEYFPHLCLASLASGRPALRVSPSNSSFISSELLVHANELSKIMEYVKSIESSPLAMDRKVLRRSALRFNERRFKIAYKKIVELCTKDISNPRIANHSPESQ